MKQISNNVAPPRDNTDISIIHSIKQVYKIIYESGRKLPKSDKLGIHAESERITRDILQKLITASFSRIPEKMKILEDVRILLEILKHSIRTEYEFQIIDQKTYIRIELPIIETSKMTNGWIKYLQKNP